MHVLFKYTRFSTTPVVTPADGFKNDLVLFMYGAYGPASVKQYMQIRIRAYQCQTYE